LSEERTNLGTQTVDRALGILSQFTFEHPSRTLTELSALSGLTLSTTHRLLGALTRHRFVQIDAVTRQYTVGSAALRLAGILLDRQSLVEVAIPIVRQARDETIETANLQWLADRRRVPIIEFESPYPLRMTSGIGRSYPLYVGAAGKAILAWLNDSERGQVLASRNQEIPLTTPRTDDALESELESIRGLGFAVSDGEVVVGATALALAIREPDGHPIASVNITGPRDRWSMERIMDYVPRLRELCTTIERRLQPSVEGLDGKD
jgi:DNA-binding IclR family transcriptional regulator